MRVRALAFKVIGAAAILLAASGYAAADSYALLGNGVCRPAGQNTGKVFSYRDYSWERCREVCSSRSCSGIEFNVLPNGTVCEHHYYPVRMQTADAKDRILSCWARQN